MLHRVLGARGLGDVLCNLPCQYPLLMSTAVKRVLPADWMLLNLKCNTDSFHILLVLLSFQASAFHSGFLEHVANKYCTPGDVQTRSAVKDSLMTGEGSAILQKQLWGALPSIPLP